MARSPAYVQDPETGSSRTREFLVRLLSSGGGPFELADGSTIPAALATVLSPSIPVSQPLYLSPAKKFAQRYLGRAAKVASSHNPDEELWVTIADVSQACRFLTTQEREVLILRYFYDNVDEDIANALSLSTTQIAELERSGLDRLVRILDNTEDS